jgi:hypothetical protein
MVHACDSTVIRSLHFRRWYSYATSTARIIQHTVALARKGDFFLKHEKKGRCFFATDSKTVCMKVSRFTKKYITSTYMQIIYKCFLQNRESCTRTLNYQKYKALVFRWDFVGSFVQQLVDSFVNSIISNLDYIERLLDRWVSFRIIWLGRGRKLICIETNIY